MTGEQRMSGDVKFWNVPARKQEPHALLRFILSGDYVLN
jgi:hypothetical protein